MTVDWRRHFNAIYARLGVAAVMTTPGTGGDDHALKVIDKTVGIPVGVGGVEISSIRPACDVRAVEFFAAGLERADIKGSSITFNGKAWDIEHHEMRPAPTGEAQGEIRMFLSEQDD